MMSHPVWVRGLKPNKRLVLDNNDMSHPVWVRGLKLFQQMSFRMVESRTLYGCVD